MYEREIADAAADRLAAIEATLAELALRGPTSDGWRKPWDELVREGLAAAPPEQRLACWAAIREAEVLPADAGLYLVAQEVKRIAWERVESEVAGVREEFAAARARRDLEEWGRTVFRPLPGADWFEAHYPLDWGKRFYAALVRHAGQDLADLFRVDPDGFEARYRAGREFFPPSEEDLVCWALRMEDAAREARTPLPEWRERAVPDGEIALAADPVEVVLAYKPVRRRRRDRVIEVLPVPYVLDITEAVRAFDTVDEVRWVPFGGPDHPDAPFVCLTGAFEGKRVRVRYLAGPLLGTGGLT